MTHTVPVFIVTVSSESLVTIVDSPTPYGGNAEAFAFSDDFIDGQLAPGRSDAPVQENRDDLRGPQVITFQNVHGDRSIRVFLHQHYAVRYGDTKRGNASVTQNDDDLVTHTVTLVESIT